MLKHFTNAKATPPASPLTKRRTWKNILGGHFGSRREAYFNFLAKDYNDCHAMITKRYTTKLEMHYLHHVSLCASPRPSP